jgi:DNA or RNA helicases of superfamily II
MVDIYTERTENKKTSISSIYDSLPYDSFLQKIKDHPSFDRDLYGLLLVDSELSYYYDCYLPNVEETRQSKSAYLKFALNYENSVYIGDFVPFFNENFSKIVRKRISEEFSKQDIQKLLALESQFYDTYKSFSAIQSFYSSRMVVLLKKFFIENKLHPSIIDSTISVISPGSSLFLLELFIQLGSFQRIERFKNNFFKMSQAGRRNLLSSPILTLCPWDHQKEAFNQWYDGSNGKGIIEMATGTGKTVVGL